LRLLALLDRDLVFFVESSIGAVFLVRGVGCFPAPALLSLYAVLLRSNASMRFSRALSLP